jgi:hypothetical protein
MDIKRTKCDQCGKEHPMKRKSYLSMSFGDDAGMISLKLPGLEGKKLPQELRETKYYDLCNIECLEALLTAYKASIPA